MGLVPKLLNKVTLYVYVSSTVQCSVNFNFDQKICGRYRSGALQSRTWVKALGTFLLHENSSLFTKNFLEKLCRVVKGQLISKCLFGVFNFFQKTNENKST